MKKIQTQLWISLVVLALAIHSPTTDKVSLTIKGISYELIENGDLLPRFYVNHREVPRTQWPKYQTEFDQLNVLLTKKHHYPKSADLK